MTINDIMQIVKGTKAYQAMLPEKDLPVLVNVDGFLLPVENVKIKNKALHVIISASALEDRDLVE